jgi:hypothetical protein
MINQNIEPTNQANYFSANIVFIFCPAKGKKFQEDFQWLSSYTRSPSDRDFCFRLMNNKN